MPSSAKTFLTAVLAVASAAVMALLLADHGAPRERHTGVKFEHRTTQEARPTAPQNLAQAQRAATAGPRG